MSGLGGYFLFWLSASSAILSLRYETRFVKCSTRKVRSFPSVSAGVSLDSDGLICWFILEIRSRIGDSIVCEVWGFTIGLGF